MENVTARNLVWVLSFIFCARSERGLGEAAQCPHRSLYPEIFNQCLLRVDLS